MKTYEIRKKSGLVVRVGGEAGDLAIFVGRPVEDALNDEYDRPRIGDKIGLLESGSKWTDDVPITTEIVGLVCEIESIDEAPLDA